MITTIRPHDIAALLDHAPDGILTVSLDCFDTLIWRATHRPHDLFADIALPGGGIEPRIDAETRAREAQARHGKSGEVSIEQIYAELPMGPENGVAGELALEARHCFAFAPTVALIRRAKAMGLTVIIVSDTYLAEPQLRDLIASVAGVDVAGMIDRIFCSSQVGMSKSQGMFDSVLRELGTSPESILHVGDNLQADGVAAEAACIHAVHIKQFDSSTEHRLRLEATAAAIFDPATTVSRPVMQLHRASVAARADGDPVWTLGHDVFGPVLNTFSQWLQDEIAVLHAETGRPVKPLFLLRDGFLPLAMLEAAGGAGAAVSISRFTARRASFTSADSIRAYLDEELTDRVDVLATQLGLTPVEAARIGTTDAAFRKGVLAADTVARIVKRSATFARRMIEHVRREGRIVAGDVVMFVDLGYRGTVQDLVSGVMEDQLSVSVTGRYLLLTDHRSDTARKRGLFDARHYDHRTLKALIGQISIVEQVATSGKGSVIDYGDNGRSKHKPCLIGDVQARTRETIQAGAIDFARGAHRAFHRPPASDDAEGRRHTALAILARLLFQPQAEEVAIIARFQHDVNLGTDELVAIVDVERAQRELRRWGLSYLREANRMFLPGELQSHGLPMSLSNMSSARFGLDLRVSDFTIGETRIPVVLAQRDQHIAQDFSAFQTHQGFYSLIVPIGAAQFSAGISIGTVGQVVQIDTVSYHHVADFNARRGTTRPAIAAQPLYDGMEEIAPGLWRCDRDSLMFVSPPVGVFDEALALSIVFRPVVGRETATGAPVRAQQSGAFAH